MNTRTQGAFSNSDVDSLETLVEIPVTEIEDLWFEFINSASGAVLTGFSIDFRLRSAGNYFVIADATADFTTPEGPVLGCSGDLTQAAADNSTVHWCRLNVRGVEMVRLRAAGTSSIIAGSFGGY